MATIRFAALEDTPIIYNFIMALAQYEQLVHEVTATLSDLETTLFGENPCAEALICIEEGQPVGFALFFRNYSTFLAKPGIHLEDLFVHPQHRNKGYGKQLLDAVIAIAKERLYGRVEWNVLDWNKSAIKFYQRMGAKPVLGWTRYRLNESDIAAYN